MMRVILVFAILVVPLGAAADQNHILPPNPTHSFKTESESPCFLTSEQESGFNRICFYDCSGSNAAVTIKISDLCSPTIRR
jgi:hypothetical protein